MNVFPFIEAEKAEQRNVKRACELLEVSRAAFYEHLHRPSRRARDDAELAAKIQAVHEESAAVTARRGCTLSCAAAGTGMAVSAGRPADARTGLAGRRQKRWQTTTSPTRPPRRPADLSAATSPPTRQTQLEAGAATSPTSPPGRAGSTWPP